MRSPPRTGLRQKARQLPSGLSAENRPWAATVVLSPCAGLLRELLACSNAGDLEGEHVSES